MATNHLFKQEMHEFYLEDKIETELKKGKTKKRKDW